METLEKTKTIAEDNRNIKKALKNAFPNYEISVKGGTGTTYGWKNIKIITDIQERLNEEGFLDYNKEEKEKFQEIRTLANNIIHGVGKRIGTYYVDDGYNTESSEVLLSVEGKRS